MKTRRALLFLTTLLSIQLLTGCTMLGVHDENLPADRNVKTVEFPVRHLKYSDIECRQEYEKVTLSGTITNASPYELANVGVKIIIFFAEETTPHEVSPYGPASPSPPARVSNSRKLTILATPPMISSHESATFEMHEKVDRPVARIEIHGFWTKVN
jgi:hypothetical protein